MFKRYKSHKIVEAVKVAIIGEEFIDPSEYKNKDHNFVVYLQVIETGEFFSKNDINFEKLFARGLPTELHFYLVKYEDGYTSWSPKEVFEKNHTQIPDVSYR